MSSIVTGISNLVASVFEIIQGLFVTVFNVFEGALNAVIGLIKNTFNLAEGVLGFVIGKAYVFQRPELVSDSTRKHLHHRNIVRSLFWIPIASATPGQATSTDLEDSYGQNQLKGMRQTREDPGGHRDNGKLCSENGTRSRLYGCGSIPQDTGI